MNKNYSPKDFFRHVPFSFLKRYFVEKGVLAEIDLTEKTEESLGLLYQAWIDLDDNFKVQMETDFNDIHALSNEAGIKALIDESEYHDENEILVETFEKNNLDGLEDRAFWAFFERKHLWRGALSFKLADTMPTTHWKRRSEFGNHPLKHDKASITHFEKLLASYFNQIHGMGKDCKVDNLRRLSQGKTLEYFFAYPEDYARRSLEWEHINNAKQLTPQARRRAFQVIFVFCQADDTLEIWYKGGAKVVTELQKIFAKALLGIDLLDQKKIKVEYDLNDFKNANKPLIYSTDSGISSILVNRLRLTIWGSKDKISLESEPTIDDSKAVYTLFEKLKKEMQGVQFNVTQVGFIATFAPVNGKVRTQKFSVSFPDSTSLKHTEHDAQLRKVLADSGIIPKPKPPKTKNPSS
jgi:hypothetical protein